MLRQRGDEPAGAAMDVLISPLAAADVEAVTALARRVWQHTYLGIISQEQIDYMLEQRYRAQLVKEELGMDTIWWDQADRRWPAGGLRLLPADRHSPAK
jgi:hypothetical protein